MNVIINQKQFNAEYMSKPEELSKGMMGRIDLDGCMVFKMGKGHHSFWMTNCLITLDIIFVSNNRLSRINHNCPVEDRHRMNQPRYTGMGNHVIEFPRGTARDLKDVVRVIMYLSTPQNPS